MKRVLLLILLMILQSALLPLQDIALAKNNKHNYPNQALFKIEQSKKENMELVFSQRYVRNRGKPKIEVDSFKALNPEDEYIITIKSGKDKKTRVSSALISINGHKIAQPKDFNKHVREIKKKIRVQKNNQIKVEVRGKPESFLVVNLYHKNHPPEIISEPGREVIAKQEYIYDVQAVDDNGDQLIYYLVSAPEGMEINSTTGLVNWVPNLSHIGKHNIKIKVADAKGGIVIQEYILNVKEPPNKAPEIVSMAPEVGKEEEEYKYNVEAEDDNKDQLTYSLSQAPAAMTINSQTGQIRWIPQDGEAGNHKVVVKVEDGRGGLDSQVFTVKIIPMNHAPEITSNPVTKILVKNIKNDGQKLDLSNWEEVIYINPNNTNPFPNWVLDDTNTVVTQTRNTSPSILLSNISLKNCEMEGVFKVNDIDDDYMGFVFGFQNRQHFYLFDWRQEYQNGIDKGLRVKVIDSDQPIQISNDNLGFSNHADFVELLYYNPISYQDNVDYNFILKFSPGEFSIIVKQDEKIIDTINIEDDTYTSGKFGFYNNSQRNVQYRGFKREIFPQGDYYYDMEALDVDGDNLIYSLVQAPTGMKIDPDSGEINWTATEEDVGEQDVTVKVEDEEGLADTQTFVIEVEKEKNNDPQITSTPKTEVKEGEEYSYDVEASDIDGDGLNYLLAKAPADMTIDRQTGQIRWTPQDGEAGSYEIVVKAEDGRGGVDNQPFTIEVESSNHVPEIISSPVATVIVENMGGKFNPIDLSVWSQVDYDWDDNWPTGNWELNSDKTIIKQTENADASIYLSGFNLQASEVEGVIKVDTDKDDDFMGFVFGYQDKGHFYLFDWKQVQDSADVGMSVKLINTNLELTHDDLWLTNNRSGIQIIYDNDIPYKDLTEYNFSLQFEAERFIIEVREGDKVLDSIEIEDDTYTIGKFGFYNCSQENVQYQGFKRKLLPQGDYYYDVEASDIDGDNLTYSLVQAPTGMKIDPDSGEINWTATEEDVGEHNVTVKVEDEEGLSDTQSFVIEVEREKNNDPQITSIAPISGKEGQEYSYDVEASDVDEDSLTYSLESKPTGMTIDPASGLISWTPQDGETGSHNVIVKVIDGRGGTDSQNFTINVAEGSNNAPQITSTAAITAKEGEEYSYKVEAIDPDGDSLSYSLTTSPEGMNINIDTGLITWIPDGTQSGNHQVIVKVADTKGESTEQKFVIKVAEVINTAPEFISTPSKVAEVGKKYLYKIEAIDLDGDSIKVSSSNIAIGMKFEKIDGILHLTWTPDSTQLGKHEVVLKVTDERGGEDVQTFTITVKEIINHNPIITSKAPLSGQEGQLYSYDVEATDSDADSLIYSLVEFPTGMTINNGTGEIRWTPEIGEAGEYSFTVKVSDSKGGILSQEVTISIAKEDNHFPEIKSTPQTIIEARNEYSYDVEAIDADGDSLSYSLLEGPMGMLIDSASGLISWTPTIYQIGENPVIVKISDSGGAVVSQEFVIRVESSLFDIRESINYLENLDLIKEKSVDLKTLAMIIKVSSMSGDNMSELKAKLKSFATEEELVKQPYVLLSIADEALAEKVSSQQDYSGAWGDDIYSTALISAALFDDNLELGSANSGLAYLESMQHTDGSWGEDKVSSVQDTAVALLALTKGGYSGEIEEKAANWLLLQQSGNGNWGSNLNTAWSTLALMELGTNDDEISKAIQFLKTTINSDGGWGIYVGEKSDPFTSALVLWTLQRYEESISEDIPEIIEGLAYLNNLVSNEVWLNKAFSYYNISEINYLLAEHSDADSLRGKYDSWLSSFPDQDNYDYLARKISILAEVGEDVTGLVNELLAGQNLDGGWGFRQGYESNPWDTILALRSLLDTGYGDLSVYQRTLQYLQGYQNSDGSFSIKAGETGHLYLTTMIIGELSRLQDIVDSSAVLDPATNWLVASRDSAGSYGGSILEDARALAVTCDVLSDAQIIDSLDYFEDNRLENGSWENDSLTTAVVVDALLKVKDRR
ncbi:putative Ig domain-containing protein [Orenia marismortui]|uniref:Prenyltransferase/squalene oxidase-like repeat protein n=1 Tax=Orenia marismortui TaxID=46469 RepID=A0A4V3GXS1_9FIRM|nr:putative Ig domain-containing protein [Orenia marismortui]TDX48919.1 prenyltransferase/squalene oxidase-like repeat protein [Orenia marismortui]